MKKYVFSAFLPLLLLLSQPILGMEDYSYNPEVDGVYYTFNDDGTAAVSHKYHYPYEVGRARMSTYSGTVVIPEYVEYEGKTYHVTSINELAFNRCSLESLTLPSSILKTGKLAFWDCHVSELHISSWGTWCNIVFDSSDYCLLSTAEHVFVGGEETDMETIEIPEGTTIIGKYCFQGCTAIKKVIIPNSVMTIGACAFYGCSGLQEIVIPDNVTELGQFAFTGCSGAKSLTIGNGVKTIPDSAFSNCEGLTTVNVPNTVEFIDVYAFMGCRSLTSVVLPIHLNIISGYVFGNCSSLTSIEIPQGVTELENGAFYECNSLTSIKIPDNVEKLGYVVFQDCI